MLRRIRASASRGIRACIVAALPWLAACDEPPAPAAASAPAHWPRPTADFAAAGDWPSYNRNLASTRYSALKQITPDNVADLRRAWTYGLGRGGGAGGAQLTPLVVEGVLYLATTDAVVALDANTGEELWRRVVAQPPRRSIAYWPGNASSRARLYFTVGGTLVALEAATGAPALEFGRNGVLETPASYDVAPTVHEDLLILGSNGPPGGIHALDAASGAPVWSFAGVPQPGEDGAQTWLDAAAAQRVHVTHEPAFTIDVDRGLLFAAFGGPEPDARYGGARPGDTLFANAIVALDVRSGRERWHFQTVRHDLWDYDLPAAPALLDVTRGGALVPVVALAGKTGYVYLLNRATGEPLFAIDEHAAPPSDTPGERVAATQPVPAAPPPVARVSFAAADLVGAEHTTPEHAQACRALAAGTSNAGPFTPLAYRSPDAPPRTTVSFPGDLGGAGWGGLATDPERGLVFINTFDLGTLGWLEQSTSGSAAEGLAGSFFRTSALGESGAPFAANAAVPGPDGSLPLWPCQQPPWGRLVAVDAARGVIAWEVPLGDTPELPDGQRRTGRFNSGGPIATAGGLVFIGATDDRRFRAFDSRNGNELWAAELPLSAHAVPITYEGGDGKQYVAIVAAGAISSRDAPPRDGRALVVYALP